VHLPERLLGVLAAMVLVAGAIGFAIEINPDRYRLQGFQPPAPVSPPSAEAEAAAQPARSYDQLSVQPWGSGARASWQVDSRGLRRAYNDPAPPSAAEHDRTPQALAARIPLRAYEGAPPAIPHPVASSGAAECLACHERGAALGQLRALPIPHSVYASCTQCHVTADASPPLPPDAAATPVQVENTFDGLRPVAFGPRVWPGSPPPLPHTTQMRENCLACHGPGGRAGMRSSHPERASCLQCHAPAASLDQRAELDPLEPPLGQRIESAR